jgi:hypothetical protein
METAETIDSKVKFIMQTDWLFQEPIDFEHKKYVLLAYFKKIEEQLKQNKLYPTFIELSLHLASLQTLTKENIVLSTEKNFSTYDDEVLLKELTAKTMPTFTGQELNEINKIIKHSSDKFFEYFNILKSYWTMIYDSIDVKIKRNLKNLNRPNGYMVYTDKDLKKIFVWEYIINQEAPSVDECNLKLRLIHKGNIKETSLNKIIEEHSSFEPKQRKNIPVFDFKTTISYPLDETLLPLFKRKMLSFIFQSTKIKPIKKIN